MSWEPLTAEGFDNLVRPLAGLEVSLPWKGAGTAVFLGLGAITPPVDPRRKGRGEATIKIEWDWRIEDRARVVCGSVNDEKEILAGIAALEGAKIRSIVVIGEIPELRVEFTDGRCLRSIVLFDDDPQWSIRLPEGRWISAKDGQVGVGDGAR
ncbi:hypothetical protein [Luteolibacter sp. Populi]|uniref:hypothetical protein n=1 Tax=Luteolibacter sp. Populi TaxID=3230487 RepID=UPI0034652B6C